MDSLLAQLNDDLAQLAGHARRGLVQIHNGRRGLGAGTIWQADGLVLTNAHVALAARRGRRMAASRRRAGLIVALPDGRRLPAGLLACDERRDLAALSVPASGLPTIELGDSRRLRPGDWVMALGHPWGVLGAATAGTVITVGPPPEMPLTADFVQVGLHLRPGHSGGPMVDADGRLVGINTMINGPNVGLAIPVHEAIAFLKEHLGRRPAGHPDQLPAQRTL